MLRSDVLQRLFLARDRLRAEEPEPRLSIREVARLSGFAPHHFIRLFHAVFGETPHPFRSLAQITRAQGLLIVS
jgi:AraC-like DNA-binding protein